jgi:glucosamine 6-phosphate synthetase-like amidotransferase/phosphosugar isomerase protein
MHFDFRFGRRTALTLSGAAMRWGGNSSCVGLSEFSDARRLLANWSMRLRRLEYRGYDSAGVATVENGHLERRRAEGKLKNLQVKLEREPLTAPSASAIPAGHPRQADREQRASARHRSLAVVHNGIIENFRELREELQKKRR